MTFLALLVITVFLWIIFIQIQLCEMNEKLKNIPVKTQIKNEIPEKAIEPEIKKEKRKAANSTVKEVKGKRFDFETAFLGNIFNKIGAIALIIGIGIFVKLMSPFFMFTPAVKIFLGYLAGILMIFFGYRMTEEKLKNFKEVLMGTGISALFVTTYCASAYFHLFENITAIIIATILLLDVYFIADKQKTVSMITIALIAGYLNPFLITDEVKPEFLFGYYILVNLLSCVYVYKNPSKSVINFINLGITFLFLSTALFKDISHVSIIYPLTLWLMYLVYDIVRKNKGIDTNDKNNVLNWLNYGVLTLFTMMIFSHQKEYIGYLTLAVGVTYAGLLYKNLEQKSEMYRPYMYSGILCVFLSTFFLSEGPYRIFLWSAESVLFSYVGFKFNIPALANWALGFIISAATGLLFIDNVVYAKDMTQYVPVWNIRTLSFIFPVASGYFSYKLLEKSENEKTKKLSEVFRFTALSLIYLYFTFEINNLVMKFVKGKYSPWFISSMLISILGFKYALQTRRIYNSNGIKLFNIAAYILGGVSLLLLLTVGCSYEPVKNFIPVLNVRFAAFIIGITTLYIFGKWTKYEWFKYLAAILGFILVHSEASDFVNLHTTMDYIVTVSWLMYAGAIILCGIFKNIKYLKNTGIWLSIIAICRIFIFDLADTDIIYKLVAFLTLGIILMVVSYFYNKKRD